MPPALDNHQLQGESGWCIPPRKPTPLCLEGPGLTLIFGDLLVASGSLGPRRSTFMRMVVLKMG